MCLCTFWGKEEKNDDNNANTDSEIEKEVRQDENRTENHSEDVTDDWKEFSHLPAKYDLTVEDIEITKERLYDEKFKFIDDLSILEVINLVMSGISSYNFKNHIASDIETCESWNHMICQKNQHIQSSLSAQNQK